MRPAPGSRTDEDGACWILSWAGVLCPLFGVLGTACVASLRSASAKSQCGPRGEHGFAAGTTKWGCGRRA